MRINYLDLRKNDELVIFPRETTVKVLGIGQDESALLSDGNRKWIFPLRKYCHLNQGCGIYNYGRRGEGRRIHVRLELRNDAWFERRRKLGL